MSISTEAQAEVKKNQEAIASLVLGVLSVILALFNLAPGLLSTLGCVGAVAAVIALLAGGRGLRAVPDVDGRGRVFAIAGMATGGLGLIIFIVAFMSTFLGTQRTMQRAIGTYEAAQAPQVFQGDGLTLTYPGDWGTVDISEQEICGQAGVECLIAIHHPSGDSTNINVMRFDLEQEASVEEVDQVLWAQFKSLTPDATLVSMEVVEIDGQPAVRRVFSAPSPEASDGWAHILQIYFVKGPVLYQFTGWAPTADALTQHRPEIEEIVGSMEFAP